MKKLLVSLLIFCCLFFSSISFAAKPIVKPSDKPMTLIFVWTCKKPSGLLVVMNNGKVVLFTSIMVKEHFDQIQKMSIKYNTEIYNINLHGDICERGSGAST